MKKKSKKEREEEVDKFLKKHGDKEEYMYTNNFSKDIFYDDLPNDEKREIDKEKKRIQKKEEKKMNKEIKETQKLGYDNYQLKKQVEKDKNRLRRKAEKEAEESTPLGQYFKYMDNEYKKSLKMPIELKEKIQKIDNIPTNILSKKDIETMKIYINHPRIKRSNLDYVKNKRERLEKKIKEYEDKNGKVEINEEENKSKEIK